MFIEMPDEYHKDDGMDLNYILYYILNYLYHLNYITRKL